MRNFCQKNKCLLNFELTKGCIINNSGKNLFIKQPNINEIDALEQAILENIKLVNNIFNMKLNFN